MNEVYAKVFSKSEYCMLLFFCFWGGEGGWVVGIERGVEGELGIAFCGVMMGLSKLRLICLL